jgi:hypothetical protein
MGKCHVVYSEGLQRMEDIINYEFTLRRSSGKEKKYARNSAHLGDSFQ